VDHIEVPEVLEEVSVEQLTELKASIKETAEALAAEAARDDEALQEIERLGAEFDRITAELAQREAAEAERAARAEEALSRFADPTPEAADEAVTEDPEGAAVEAAAEEVTIEEEATEADPLAVTVEAATEDATLATEEAITEASTEPEAITMAAVEEPVVTAEDAPAELTAEAVTLESVPEVPSTEIVEAAIEDDTPSTAPTTTEPEAPMSDNTPIREEVAVAALEAARPDGLAPAMSRSAGFNIMRATNSAAGVNEGEELSTASLAEAITRKVHGLTNTPTGTYERIVVGTMVADYGDHRLSSGAEENYGVIAGLQKEAQALVAAGGNCAPLAPSYDFFRLAEALNPVEMCLPAVEAPRGGIRFITPPDFRDADGGVRVTTEAEDAAGYPPTAPKPCVRVACPPIEECRVDAVSQCVTFGNLNYRVFPEQVEAFLEDLNVIFTETKEIFYLDAIDAASTAVTSTPAYGASRGIVQDLAAAAAAYRRRNHMSPMAQLNVMLPSWILELLKVDMVNDHSDGLMYFCSDTMEQLDCLFRDLHLTPCYYYDSATGAGQSFNGAQGVGALNAFPSTVVSYLFAPGTFVRLDAGTLDLGIVRDSVLNGTNDLQIFSEQWIQVCQVGLESIRLEHTLCPDGTAPEPVLPLVCA
jgi:hypothetical protein